MTVKECYEAMGGDYDSVISRLRKDERVQKFLKKVLDDPSFPLLERSLKERNMEEAFRAAHTMKGICQNLSLDSLYGSSDRMCERLRGATEYESDMEALFEQVRQDYDRVAECIRAL